MFRIYLLSLSKTTSIINLLLLLVGLNACNTPLDPPEVVTNKLFRLENMLGTWQLKSASASIGGGVLVIDDLFDPAKNPQAAQTLCIKNSFLELRRGGLFGETAACYAPNGGTATESGSYVYEGTPSKTTIALTYDKGNAVIPDRTYTVEDLQNGNVLKLSFTATQQGITAQITYTYERQ